MEQTEIKNAEDEKEAIVEFGRIEVNKKIKARRRRMNKIQKASRKANRRAA